MSEMFHIFAQKVSNLVGHAWAFALACILIIVWAASGPYFHFSDTWELIINTLTTIITFLMVFVIQNSQNREVKTLNLKLDELIRASKQARNNFIELEELSEAELDTLEEDFYKLVKTAKTKTQNQPKTIHHHHHHHHYH